MVFTYLSQQRQVLCSSDLHGLSPILLLACVQDNSGFWFTPLLKCSRMASSDKGVESFVQYKLLTAFVKTAASYWIEKISEDLPSPDLAAIGCVAPSDEAVGLRAQNGHKSSDAQMNEKRKMPAPLTYPNEFHGWPCWHNRLWISICSIARATLLRAVRYLQHMKIREIKSG